MAGEAPKISPSDLMSSAKTAVEAAQVAASQQMDKISGAAGDLIEAAKTSVKPDDKQQGIAGQYLEKAKGYLPGGK